MDKQLVFGGGRILFDSDNQQSTGTRTSKTASELVHIIISEGVFYETDSNLIPPETDDWDEESDKFSDNVHLHKQDQNGSFRCNDPMSMCKWRPRLWQVVPLLKRLSMEYPIEWKEVLVLPVSYLLLSAWGSLGSDISPIQRFTVRISALV